MKSEPPPAERSPVIIPPAAVAMPDEAAFRKQLRRSTLQVLLALTIPMLVLLGMVIVLLSSESWLDHSDRVLLQLNHARVLMADMQSNVRGYRLFGDRSLLDNYHDARADMEPCFASLEQLVADNPSRHAAAVALQQQTEGWMAIVDSSLATNTNTGLAFRPSPAKLGRRAMDAAVGTADKMLSAEQDLRVTRNQTLVRVITALMAVFLAFIIGGIPALLFHLRAVLRQTVGFYKASRAAAELRANELQVTLSSIGDAVIATDARGKIEFLNPVAVTLTGWSAAEAMGRELAEVFTIFNEHTRTAVENPVERVLRENIIVGLANHTVLRTRGGLEVPIEDSAAPIRDAAGEIIGVILVFHDVTINRANEHRLVEAEWHARAALQFGDASAWVWDIANDRLRGDGLLAKLFNVPPGSCREGAPISAFVDAIVEEDRPMVEAAIKESVATGTPYHSEHRVRGADGQVRWVNVRAGLVKNELDEPDKMIGFLLDTTERKRAEQALVDSNERFRLLAEVVEIQVWTANPAGELDYANQQCVDYINADRERDILGNAWAQFVHPEDLPGALQRWQHSLATGERYEVEFRLRGHRGDYRWFLVRAKAMRDAGGRITRWFGTNTEIHALKLAQEEALQASRAKDNFLAALSHELRTPLTPVLMMATALRDDASLPPVMREQLGMMERNIALEARLIDDLLDITYITRGKLLLRPQECDSHALINLAVEIVREEALAKKIGIERDFAARNSGLQVDPARFQQVIWNLLRNAVKFTAPGGKVRIRTSDHDDHWLQIEVVDTGIGIAPEALDKIFLPFEQAHTTGDHRFGGVGLGLAIARAIVDLHHGTIHATSPGAGQGAVFTVRLPGADRPPSGTSATGALPPAVPESALFQPAAFRLLLVEDHPSTLKVLSSMLRRDGFQVVAASSLAEARTAAEASTFDLVVSDLGLSDGTGTELMQELSARYGLKGIALSGYGMEEDVARSRASGFVTHLTKPIQFADLRRALREHLGSGV